MQPTDGDGDTFSTANRMAIDAFWSFIQGVEIFKAWSLQCRTHDNVEDSAAIQTVLREMVITEKQASKNMKLVKLTESADNNE